jgi:hypothetical protein
VLGFTLDGLRAAAVRDGHVVSCARETLREVAPIIPVPMMPTFIDPCLPK